MATMSMLEKLKLLFEISMTSKIYIIAIIIIAFLALILLTTNKSNTKSSKMLLFLLYVFIITSAVVLYKESLNSMCNYLINNIFISVYFPNLAIYLVAIVITSIILWVSVFDYKTSKIIKNINIIACSLIYYLLIVLLNIVNEQNLDVFSQTSIYTNKSAQAVIELTSSLFIIWIIFLCLYKVIRIYQTKNNILELPPKEHKHKRKLPKGIKEINFPYVIKKEITMTEEEKKLKEYTNLLTVEDYKLLLSILKDKRASDRRKEAQKIKEQKELDKFHELQELYRVR